MDQFVADESLYLDYAAATPVDARVLAQMQPYFSDVFYNPSALHSGGVAAKVGLDTARAQVARNLGCRPSEIIFTAGGTESANTAVYGVIGQHDNAHMLLSGIEHEAVLRAAEMVNHTVINVHKNGLVDLVALESAISDQTLLVSVMLVNNEVGTLQPVKEVVAMVERIRRNRAQRNIKTPLYVHTDACQAPLYLDVHIKQLGVDLMTLNGGKMYGPKQSGILYIRSNVDFQPLIHGGGQEFGRRSGTENVAFAVGFAAAFDLAVHGRT